MRSDKALAIKLRRNGLTYSQIGLKLGVSKSTLSSWLKNLNLDKKASAKIHQHIQAIKIKKLIKRNKDRSKLIQNKHEKNRAKASKEAIRFLSDPLFITGLALYWGEGYKKGAQGSKWKSIDFANSDPEMIRIMMKFFLRFLPITKSDITAQLMLHNNSESQDKKSIAFWKKITKLDSNNFCKVSHVISKASRKKTINKLPHGTIHIRINNVNLFFRLIGWIDFLKKKFEN